MRQYYAARFGESNVIVREDDSQRPFNKSRMMNDGVRLCGLDSVVILADADCFVCDWSLKRAIEIAADGDQLVVPHSSVCRMTRAQSRRVMKWVPSDRISGKLYRDQRRPACPGGLWVVRADLFQTYRMDERFEGWGGEDTEFLRRIPHRRIGGPLFHLWHTKAPKVYLRRNRKLLAGRNLGRIRYRGVIAQQHPGAFDALGEFFCRYIPARIVEIGTAAGGLTMMLADLVTNAKIRTYDVRPCRNSAALRRMGIDLRVADSRQIADDLGSFAGQPGRTVIVCDGGNKPAEVKMAAELAKSGDIILAHDYAPDRQRWLSHYRGRIWNWCEITDAHIPDRLKKLREPRLAGCAWLAAEVQ